MPLRLLVLVMLAGTAVSACESRAPEIRVAAQDFRFTPAEIRLSAARPAFLRIVNEGREPHEFQTPLLATVYARVQSDPEALQRASADAIRILPGHAVTILIQAPTGVYLFRCQVRGHAGMTGTIIVEE